MHSNVQLLYLLLTFAVGVDVVLIAIKFPSINSNDSHSNALGNAELIALKEGNLLFC